MKESQSSGKSSEVDITSSSEDEEKDTGARDAQLPFKRVSQLGEFPLDFKNQFRRSAPESATRGRKRKRTSGKKRKTRKRKK